MDKAVLYIGDDFLFDLFSLGKNQITIGRADFRNSPDVDIGPFDSSLYVSRRHGLFVVSSECIEYVDLSRNGSFLNGVKLRKNKKTKLNNNDKLILANIEILINIA